MSLWTLNQPPPFKNPKGRELIATERGWTDPDTGEVLVAIGNLSTKAGASIITHVSFNAAALAQGDALAVTVHFAEKVDVAAGVSIVVTLTGGSNVTLKALAQTATADVLFDRDSGGVSAAVVPAGAAVLSIAAQSLVGSINDNVDAVASNKSITSAVGLAAATRSVPSIITAASFGALTYAPADPLSVTVHFNDLVNVSAGASIVLSSTIAPITLYALAQSGVNDVVFDRESDNSTPASVANADDTLSLSAQTLEGVIADVDTSASANLHLSSAVASAAGNRAVVEV